MAWVPLPQLFNKGHVELDHENQVSDSGLS